MSVETPEERDEADGAQTPGDDEQYCPECGEIILRKADVCPECGVSTSVENHGSMHIGGGGYLLSGGLSGPLAFFIPLFGLLAVYCGVRLYQDYSTKWGIVTGIWGGLSVLASSAFWIWIFT